MNLKRAIIVALVLVFAASGVYAADESSTKVGGMFFGDWRMGLTEAGDNDTGSDQTNTFEFTRAWFIVSHKFDDMWSAMMIGGFENTDTDAGGKQYYNGYLFLANLQAKKAFGPAVMTFQFGLIDPPLVIWSEKLSDQRWIHINCLTGGGGLLPSGVTPSQATDLGVKLQFDIMKMVQIVATATNGEGRKNVVEGDDGDSAEGKAYEGRITVTPIPALYISGYYGQIGTGPKEGDDNHGYYGVGINYRDKKMINVGLHVLFPTYNAGGEAVQNAEGNDINEIIVDTHIGIYLKDMIGMPIFIMAKYGYGEDQDLEDSRKTYMGAGIGYQFTKGVRAIAWYDQTDSAAADAANAANPQAAFSIKFEWKF